MAYKAKYAKKNDRVSPFFILLGVIVVPVALALTILLLGQMIQFVGRFKTVEQPKTEDMTIGADFGNAISGEVDDLREALVSGQSVNTSTTTPEKEKVILEIPKEAQVAPKPNPECYGQTTNPATLQWLLDEAEYMLDGQELYFSTDVEIFEGSTVNYYLDDTIFAITWKEVHDNSVYTFSEVKINHPSQFRRHLAGGEYGASVQLYPTEMAQTVNAVVASSGDFYRNRANGFGINVYQGEVRRVEGTYAETCYIDSNGDMNFTYGGDILTTEAAKQYVADNDIWFSICFGPILVDNYEVIDHTTYGVGEITEGYARSALCQMGQLHYLIGIANVEGQYMDVPTVKEFQKNIAATGCRMAYCLDGGQTAVIAMDGELINRPAKGSQRKISDIIYFATAVPEGE